MADDNPSDAVSRPNRGGRPRATDPGERVSTWIPSSEYDRLIHIARVRGQSLSATVSTLVRLSLKRSGSRDA